MTHLIDTHKSFFSILPSTEASTQDVVEMAEATSALLRVFEKRIEDARTIALVRTKLQEALLLAWQARANQQ